MYSPTGRLRRKPVLITTGAAALTVAVAAGVGVAIADTSESVEAGRYIVQLAEPPVATYQGGTRGLAATATDGDRIDPDAAAVAAYRTHLADRRQQVLTAADVTTTVHEYDLVYNGFVADLSGDQVTALVADDAVVAVHPDEEVLADTSTTPTFLGLAGDDGAWEQRFGSVDGAGEGVIVGIIDSGFWPENPSFAALPEPRPDQGLIDAKWNGECVTGDETDPSDNVTCNNKVIGARYYPVGVDMVAEEFQSPRDYHGHGSHVGGTAAGNHAVEAGSYGLISGMAPAARIAMYKACWRTSESGCNLLHSNGMQALEDAVADGVDVINYSISGATDTAFDPMHQAFLNTVAAGVFVATSAGNNGPGVSTVAHNVPWMTTVASGTHDRDTARAPALADSSSAGPAIAGDGDLLKPDILAPGVSVRAAQSPAGSSSGSMFGTWSGTSMASPHIAGLAALLLSMNPQWSPMAVKSALMTTATTVDNTGEPIQRGGDADPFDYGSGLVRPGDASDPGLVFESGPDDWWRYGCGIGEITGTVCDDLGAIDPSDLNYPSIAVGALTGEQTVERTVTNVTGQAVEFTASVTAPDGVDVTVDQETLTLEPGGSATYSVTLRITDAPAGSYVFGALTWTSSVGHVVTSPIALKPV
ncbi:peptidase inhibitor I9 [Stackebrandtia endophytica]|uniref:Peptidase inhibitor I9 n=1 Tax=Stackebrandtia endophytica TaxID=1496996 RepID=A0A543APQ8_9ACTN|nr:S8 family serine peptidase [Stackebrandtia endophytica]TQL74562.1 peptidase inhibitor I9 [Stackebrandtia endophytica]